MVLAIRGWQQLEPLHSIRYTEKSLKTILLVNRPHSRNREIVIGNW